MYTVHKGSKPKTRPPPLVESKCLLCIIIGNGNTLQQKQQDDEVG